MRITCSSILQMGGLTFVQGCVKSACASSLMQMTPALFDLLADPLPYVTTLGNHCSKLHRRDNCNMIVMKYSITFSRFRLMNPQINADCTNLWANTSYRVALVSGNNVTATATSSASPTTSSTSGSTNSSPTSTTVAPPAPTQAGTTSSCYGWYVSVPGDDCSKIDSQYSITFAQLRAWNPY
jgi:LysM repeat protein